jgi:Tfp pilus assembly protein PilF
MTGILSLVSPGHLQILAMRSAMRSLLALFSLILLGTQFHEHGDEDEEQLMMGLALARRGEKQLARSIWMRLAESDSNVAARAAANLGVLLRQLGEHDEAESMTRRALESADGSASGHAAFHYGTWLYEQGRRDESARFLEQATQSPGLAEADREYARLALCVALSELGQPDAARRQWAALNKTLAPSSPYTSYRLARQLLD